jgi:hypothetical protein
MEEKIMFKWQHALAIVVLAIMAAYLTGPIQAQSPKADPTGTWKWEMPGRNGQAMEMTLKVAKAGDAYTATLVAPNREIKADKVQFKDDTLSFVLNRTGRQGRQMSITYSGKVQGDTIKGKIQAGPGPGRDWEAKRHNG